MNIKKGDVLKHKGWDGKVKVLAIINERYFLSGEDDNLGLDFCTLEGLKETFELPEEKWVPVDGELYYFISSEGEVRQTEWDDDRLDEERHKISNVFMEKEAAEAKLAEVLAVLKK